jgi:hypothetical protein
MFIYSLQRRAGGVELRAVLPSHGYADATYFVRVAGEDATDVHFPDEVSASRAFAERVCDAAVADVPKQPPGVSKERAHC